MFRRFVWPHCKNFKLLCMFPIMLQSSKSGVASSWCRQIWEVCGNTFFICWRSASYWNFIKLITENSKWDALLPFEYELDWTTFLASGTSHKWISMEKTLKNELEIHQTGHWKFKMGYPLPCEYELRQTAFLASGTPQKWISRGKRLKNDFQGQPADLQHMKTYYYTHLKFGGTSYW